MNVRSQSAGRLIAGRGWLIFCVLLTLCCPTMLRAQAADAGLYVPTPQSIVDAMLGLAKVGPGDVVIDLGSGDGRIPRTAAARHGARGIGVDIDPQLVAMARAAAQKEGVAGRTEFVAKDLWQFDISNATVVTIYLLPRIMPRLKQKLLAELKPGTRIVAHDYALPDWVPTEQRTIDEPLKLAVNGTDKAYLYLYIVPPR